MKPIDYIHRCIELAAHGKGWVNPNPLVGCVIVHNDKIIAEGWHKAFGQAHAERMAIDDYLLKGGDSEVLKDSDLYVSLEPCSHFGKTPPCADLLVHYQFRKVYVALLDPNPLVSGMGIQRLRDSGIEVEMGLAIEEARLQNRFFLCYHEKKRPFIVLKWAESSDGFIAPLSRERTAISGLESQKYVHALRQECSAILVGRTTMIGDNPQLTDRYFGGPQPVKFVLTSLAEKGPIDDFQVVQSAEELIEKCLEQGLNSVLIEGGLQTLNHFLSKELVDEIHLLRSKSMLLTSGIEGPKFNSSQFEKGLISENDNDFITVYRRIY